MAKNLRALSKTELDFLKEKYKFELFGDFIVTSCAGIDRKILHPINKSFAINTPIRKITISELAIKMWIEHFQSNYNLLEVQNAISSLIVTYQDISVEDVGKILAKGGTLITLV